ncbi:MAG: helix-turn-helix domain-containing protein [Lachnospiraceae bacterium]|nr:helix-turn-helix domain-containing protein [Lachnospiraceae bacterium]
MAKKKENLEFRYYEVPHGEPLLALLGEVWVRPYGYDEYGQPLSHLHFHNLTEIGYCYEGQGTLVLEESQFEYGPGTITMIPKNYPHTTSGVDRSNNRWEYLFIDAEKVLPSFYPDDPRQAGEQLARVHRNAFCTSCEDSPTLAILIQSILREMVDRKEHYADAVNGLLRALFIEISRHQPVLIENGKTSGTHPGPDSIQISRALEYVGDHFEKPLRVGDLAGVCHMSETHFRRLFGECMGQTPTDYINQVRVRAACELLQKSNEPIAEVAEKCGFCSLATFNRNFRHYMNATPKEWRKSPEAYEHRLSGKNIRMLDGWS